MADGLTREQRSRNMAAIKSRDTKPERMVRQYLHAHGYRFRLHDKQLPGKPDIVLKKWNTLIFVNGCYWHRHPGCRLAYNPKSNVDFWEEKFKDNVDRDQRNIRALTALGWKVIVIWECEVKSNTFKAWLESRIKAQLPDF